MDEEVKSFKFIHSALTVVFRLQMNKAALCRFEEINLVFSPINEMSAIKCTCCCTIMSGLFDERGDQTKEENKAGAVTFLN